METITNQKASTEHTNKAAEYQQIYLEGKKWRQKFNEGFWFSDYPQNEQPEFLPGIFHNSGKLSKNTNKVSSAMEQTLKYL